MKGLDLFSGAGGCSMGYHRAGFEMTGVDNRPQPRYPFRFVQTDALEYVEEHGHEYDFIAASPPCQAFSVMSACRPGLRRLYEELIVDARRLLQDTGLPYVIENVPGAPLRFPITLCGQMFGLDLYRHRLFESNFTLVSPDHPPHTKPASRAGHWTPGTVMSVAGHIAPIAVAREAMGISWMNRDELSEAIPPAYCEWVGAQLLTHLRAAA